MAAPDRASLAEDTTVREKASAPSMVDWEQSVHDTMQNWFVGHEITLLEQLDADKHSTVHSSLGSQVIEGEGHGLLSEHSM
jgi:hypothetical protein